MRGACQSPPLCLLLLLIGFFFGVGLFFGACGPSTPEEEDTDLDGDGATDTRDCDESDPEVYTGALEKCDEKDNDCDGAIDEEVTQLFYSDADGDGFGSSSKTTSACTLPEGYAVNDFDCDDRDAEINPNAKEICNGEDDDCDDETDEGFDKDRDGYTSCSGDCDDTDSSIKPNTSELCNGIDDNCDGKIVTSSMDESDGDNDGALACEECDDDNPDARPGLEEVCDDVDNDCDGEIDEGVSTTYCPDEDSDQYGDQEQSITSCGSAPEGASTVCTDCDDSNPDIHPNATEDCNGVDDDCDGAPGSDEVDEDQDGWTVCRGDCDDANADVFPDNPDICDDGIDQDCLSGDEHCPDQDNDGDGFSDDDGDCDDGDVTVYPGADENCTDGIDSDCDGIEEDPDESYDAEPNDSMSDAIDLGTLDESSSTVTCKTMDGLLESEDDADFYKFYSIDQANDDWAISAVVTVPEGVTYCIDIYDETTAEFADTVCAEGPTQAVSRVDFVIYVVTGYYWVKVYSDGPNSCEPYPITICAY